MESLQSAVALGTGARGNQITDWKSEYQYQKSKISLAYPKVVADLSSTELRPTSSSLLASPRAPRPACVRSTNKLTTM